MQNKDFTGSYKETDFKAYNYYPEFKYKTSSGDTFSVDENGKLVSYFDSDRKLTQAVLSQEECVQKAKEFLEDMVDTTPYTVNAIENTKGEYYEITFIKYINGIKTTDHIMLSVNYDGTIYSYSAFMLDRVPVNTKTEDIDFQKIDQAIIEKADSIYNDIKDNYDRIDYSEPEYILTILKDGKRAVLCNMDITAVNILGENEMRTSEVLKMVIPIE